MELLLKKHLLLYILKTIVLLHFLKKTMLLSSILLGIERSKEQHLFKIEILCSIINIFTVTFDQFNASQINKSISFKTFIIYSYATKSTVNLVHMTHVLLSKTEVIQDLQNLHLSFMIVHTKFDVKCYCFSHVS